MNCFILMTRRLISLNKLFYLNKFENNININKIKFLRHLSNHIILDETEKFENQLKLIKGSGGQTTDHLKRLVFSYIQRYDSFNPNQKSNPVIVSRVKQIAEELDKNPNKSNDPIYSALMEFFTNCGDLESALSMKNRVSQTFLLDSFKVFNLGTLLVKNDRTNAAINLIERERNLYLNRQKSRHFRDIREDFKLKRDKSINKLLNSMIDKQIDTTIIRKMFEMCADINPTQVNRTIAGPLIRMHLVNRDFQSALKEFLFCANNYRGLPWSLELMRIFIELKDRKSLDIIVKKSSIIIGPNNTALDLCAAFLYNGSVDEAKQQMSKISRIQQKTVEMICNKFITDKRLNELKTFILMIQSIDGIDKQKLLDLLNITYKQFGQTLSIP